MLAGGSVVAQKGRNKGVENGNPKGNHRGCGLHQQHLLGKLANRLRGLIDQAYLDGLRPDHWQAFFASQLQPGSLEARVAMLGPEAAGAVAYGAFIPPTGSQVPARGDGYVQALYVRPAFMRQGVGSGLLQAAEEGLRAMGYRTAFLYVLDTNEKARRFYEKQGYRWNGERLGCRAGEQELTDLCYEKPLGE